jgi:hypothetical protein
VARGAVHVDLGEHELPLRLVREPLESRPEHPARTAPGSPEVHEDRHLVRTLDHFLLELVVGNVLDPAHEANTHVV